MRAGLRDQPSLITADEIPDWVSGTVLSDSKPRGWRGVKQRTYEFHGQDVELPPMDCFKIVQYLKGTTPMDRQIEGRWTRTECGPGQFSLLSRGTRTQWNWTEDLIVSHVYLSDNLMRRVAADFRGEDAQVNLHDVLRAADPVVTYLMNQITAEAKWDTPGGALYAESLAVQLAVHLLRNYASCVLAVRPVQNALTQRQLWILEDYIAAHLHDQISLKDMARVLDIGISTFHRRVKRTLGKSACKLVLERRVERARALLAGRISMPIKQVASACGFSDQAHLTRTFRAALAVTPAQYRQQV